MEPVSISTHRKIEGQATTSWLVCVVHIHNIKRCQIEVNGRKRFTYNKDLVCVETNKSMNLHDTHSRSVKLRKGKYGHHR